jgi:hypothetical protein
MDTSSHSHVEALDGLGAHLLGAPDAPAEVRSAVAAVCALALPVPPVAVPYAGPWQGMYRAWLRHAAHLDVVASARGRALSHAIQWAITLDEVTP